MLSNTYIESDSYNRCGTRNAPKYLLSDVKDFYINNKKEYLPAISQIPSTFTFQITEQTHKTIEKKH